MAIGVEVDDGGAGFLTHHVHVHGRAAFAAATELMTHYGEHAEDEAANRADRSRSLGNLIHFCHWRQIERAIAMLRGECATGRVH